MQHRSTIDDASSNPGAPAYEPPGPGSWQADLDHQSAPRGHLFNELFLPGYEAGFADTFRRYGLPLETLQARVVHGWMYTKPKVAAAPDKGGPPPPDFVLKLLTRLHPEMRRRTRAARQAIETRLWLRDAEQWETERGGWIDEATSLLGQDLVTMSDADLRQHVEAASSLAKRMMLRHFELIGPAIAIGRLLVAGRKWGLDGRTVRELMAGASPASAATNEPLREIARLVAAADVEPASYDELRAVSPEVATRVDAYLSVWGWRMTGDSLEAPTLAEEPDRFLDLLAGVGGSQPADHERIRAGLRANVPADERADFDRLVDEARAAYPSLDDNSGVLTLALGVFKRAVLEVARRTNGDGRTESLAEMSLLHLDELVAFAGGETAVERSELQARAATLAAAAGLPPAVLGDEPSPPPDPSVFPKPMAEVTAAIFAFIEQKFSGERQAPSDEGRLMVDGAQAAIGHAIGNGTASGKIVVAIEVSDALDRLEVGDILVCPNTGPGWNSIFPMLGGIVTQFGGPLGHTAVMAREFGLPAVVGVGEIDRAWDGRHATIEL